ncbi:MAG: hypothetical protein Q8T09_08785 [Candidatus Melainabacteria bacterium]|nr:hypothetical protein [Candidatus Melainabacteria bacterium]
MDVLFVQVSSVMVACAAFLRNQPWPDRRYRVATKLPNKWKGPEKESNPFGLKLSAIAIEVFVVENFYCVEFIDLNLMLMPSFNRSSAWSRVSESIGVPISD